VHRLLINGDLDRFRFGFLFTRGIIRVRRAGTDGRLSFLFLATSTANVSGLKVILLASN
jgi:hypothetical protein